MANLQKQEYVKRLRKADSTLRQAVLKISVDEGASVGDFSFMNNDDFFYSFVNVLNTNKVCYENNQGCFTDKIMIGLNGSQWGNYHNNKNSLITNDGIAYEWRNSINGNICTAKGLSTEDEANCIGRFIVDINGEANPNQFGRDIFFFAVVDNKGIVQAGSGNNSRDCTKSNNGLTCAAKVLQEDKMSY